MGSLLGFIGFTSPWLLLGLLSLPVLWLLMRLTPPAPRQVVFPALRLLIGLKAEEETPARLPWWLVLLRMAAVFLLVLGLSGPVLDPNAAISGKGPLVLVIDNDWSVTASWNERRTAALQLVSQAEREERPVLLLWTAPDPQLLARGESRLADAAPAPVPAQIARQTLETLAPRPWPADRALLAREVERLSLHGVPVVWIASSVVSGKDDQTGTTRLMEALRRLGGLAVLRAPVPDAPVALTGIEEDDGALAVSLVWAGGGPQQHLTVRARDASGRLLEEQGVDYAAGQRAAEARFTLPLELRNRVARIDASASAAEGSAASVMLLDSRHRQPLLGLIEAPGSEAQPLLDDAFYLERALEPYGQMRKGGLQQLIGAGVNVLVMGDAPNPPEAETASLTRWVEAGGVLVRFAGSALANAEDPLVPVRLRHGERQLSGALSWSEPEKLAPFSENSPFYGLPVPPDVTVSRQVLAEPSIDLDDHTWARLVDGTPLVTAAHRGKGLLVLVHTTAEPGWSNLALSGLFVDMLRRVVTLAEGSSVAPPDKPLAPAALMDAYGHLSSSDDAMPIDGKTFAETVAGPRHPPGYYGDETERFALNLGPALAGVALFPALPAGVATGGLVAHAERAIGPLALTLALALALIDFALSVLMRGASGRLRRRAASTVALLGLLLAGGGAFLPGAARADAALSPAEEEFALKATGDTQLAWVRTGDEETDRVVEAGLKSLAGVLRQRTALDDVGTMAVDPEKDELSFFPLLYWAITDDAAPPSQQAIEKLEDYIRLGGTIFFDTRDADATFSGPRGQALRRVAADLSLPPLGPMPTQHVMTKAFYLLQDFPGRYSGGALWVEARDEGDQDGVSSVIVGSNDYVGAWATDEFGRPLYAAVPGGEQQREMAFRTGINLVMYTLTGNYKADQVHVPAILERLGQ
ncbi:DUF4159 domain-containing protein [Radicibacter daui]|uniref:DUF4159 domain-containing protein n=1 Tax=Radicibacter daui TaxID=3064829 RepID=UPI004046E091